MKKYKILLKIIIVCLLFVGCQTKSNKNERNDKIMTQAKFPNKLTQIPQDYYNQSTQPGSLVELKYDTYEAMSYKSHQQILHKRAIVYLPSGYNQGKNYNVVYLMHGGWSNETTYLGTPKSPSEFKNVLDNAILNKQMQPMIVVCPTYNNTSQEDSSDYSLAIQLTNLYHQELINDLIPAVESTYSTYAKSTDEEGIKSSRNHRAFAGFSMGSVATWRTFQYCLDDFRYFLPSSGNLTSNGEAMAKIVKDQGYSWSDFFIFATSGTDDFAYSAFKQQIEAMLNVKDHTFRYANNEQEGNLYYLWQKGGIHNGEYAIEYFYNGFCWLWQ